MLDPSARRSVLPNAPGWVQGRPERGTPAKLAAWQGFNRFGGRRAGGPLNLDQRGRECKRSVSGAEVLPPEPPKDLASI